MPSQLVPSPSTNISLLQTPRPWVLAYGSIGHTDFGFSNRMFAPASDCIGHRVSFVGANPTLISPCCIIFSPLLLSCSIYFNNNNNNNKNLSLFLLCGSLRLAFLSVCLTWHTLFLLGCFLILCLEAGCGYAHVGAVPQYFQVDP